MMARGNVRWISPAQRKLNGILSVTRAAFGRIVRRLADREVKPQALRRFQPLRGHGGFHSLKKAVVIVIARDGTTPDQLVVASRQQRRDRDRALEAFAGLIKTAELREQIAQ